MRLVTLLQEDLQAAADLATKAWFERYLRHAIRYRGVRTPEIARLTAAWYRQAGVAALSASQQLEVAAALMRQPMAEDKLAATILLGKVLLKRVPHDDVLDMAEALFRDGAFFDWSTTDWFSVRVLAPLVKQGHGSDRIAGWKHSRFLWQRRCAITGLRSVVGDPAQDALINGVIATLVKEDERFIQTAVGWVIADLAKVRPEAAARIVEAHLTDLSPEVIRRHTKRLPRHQAYRQAKKRPGRIPRQSS